MRRATLVTLSLLLSACGAAAEPTTTSVSEAWHGKFADERCTPGDVVVFLDEHDHGSFGGSMYFETEWGMRATYRIEASLEEGGMLNVVQKEVEQADRLQGMRWCLGTYSLQLGSNESGQALAGSYTNPEGGCECGGTANLTPYE
jgi:hypothetical protein